MIHLIRNAVDHALEHPSERLEKGKPRVGRITLWAGHEGDRVAIRVEDNGRGLDREKIVKKGIALGMVPTGTPADDPRVVGLIFEPGFSTRDTVSELSGRGRRARRRARRRPRAARQRGGGEHARQGNSLHLPSAAHTGSDRRATGRDGRGSLCGPARSGRGMRGLERHPVGIVAGTAMRGGAGRTRADGLASQPVPSGRTRCRRGKNYYSPGTPASGSAWPSIGWWAASRRSSSRWARACTA